MRVAGKIVRFDGIRGYGFISPEIGGEDVFLHANDLEMDKPLARPGTRVSFDIEEGDRGKFATNVRLASTPPETHSASSDDPDSNADDYYDLLTVDEFKRAVTEVLLQLGRPLGGDQIIEVRASLEAFARKHGWIEP